jgi:type VI secretion system secreted protein VgrG
LPSNIWTSFPNLGSGYAVLGPATPRYNCVSWTLGTTGSWTWPGSQYSSHASLYASAGYQRLSHMNTGYQPGVQKIAIYGKYNQYGGFAVTHVARQEPGGGWTSKLGALPLIWHPSLDSLSGPSYGQPVAVYARRVAQPAPAPQYRTYASSTPTQVYYSTPVSAPTYYVR